MSQPLYNHDTSDAFLHSRDSAPNPLRQQINHIRPRPVQTKN